MARNYSSLAISSCTRTQPLEGVDGIPGSPRAFHLRSRLLAVRFGQRPDHLPCWWPMTVTGERLAQVADLLRAGLDVRIRSLQIQAHFQ